MVLLDESVNPMRLLDPVPFPHPLFSFTVVRLSGSTDYREASTGLCVILVKG